LALAIDERIGAGYPPQDVWEVTPRQIAASLALARSRQRRALADHLAVAALAARGEGDDIKAHIRKLTTDA
jgi:hypothetical protein